MNPKLRLLQPRVAQYRGQRVILLQDPLRLSDKVIYLPVQLAPLLSLCDGTRDESQLRAALMVRTGIPITTSSLSDLLSQLDEALLLENEHFQQAYAAALESFRSAPYRSPALAGESYPENPADLEALLADYIMRSIPEDRTVDEGSGKLRGLISPHIDFARGGMVYGAVWGQARETLKQVELVLLLGTDHMGSDTPLTLTRQNYATPWGVLPTDQRIVESLADIWGEEAFRNELHHRGEHSLELALVWLHFLLKDRQCRIVPILCGSFERYIEGQLDPSQDPFLDKVVSVLQEATKDSRALVVAAGDLAHEGPAFGDPQPMDFVRRAMSKAADEKLMEFICAGDAAGFFQEIKSEGDRRHVCGLPPIYLALRVLGQARGQVLAYSQCPADDQGASFVSICGIALT